MEGIHFNVETAFTNTQPSPIQNQRIDRVLAASKGLAETLVHECGRESPEIQLSLSLLQQATFAARQAILTTGYGVGTGHSGG